MEFQSCFPVWDRLSADQQSRILSNLVFREIKKGTVIHSGSADCTGLLLVKSGQLRAYILSDEGREITIYRLFDRDICLFSASCMLRSAQFNITIEAEKDTGLWVIPAEVYRSIMEQSAPLSNYTNEVMAARFSEVMWLVEQRLKRRTGCPSPTRPSPTTWGPTGRWSPGCSATYRARAWSGCPGARWSF